MIEEGAKISGGGEMRICRRCSDPFVFYRSPVPWENSAKTCPECTDRIQARPSVIMERRVLNFFSPVLVKSLPKNDWVLTDTGYHFDKGLYKIDVSGKPYGASWSGRIVIYSNKIIAPGDIICIREMQAVHKVKKIRYARPTMEHGTIMQEQTVPLQSENEEAFESREFHPYLVFEKFEIHENPVMLSLSWISRYSKTTLKGFGRQYRYKIDTSIAVAAWSVSGGVRSGRAHTESVLAITTPENPVVVTGSGDAEGEEFII